MSKYDRAIALLQQEAVKVGGEVFARWWATKNDETKKTVEAFDFMDNLFGGGKVDDKEVAAVREMNAIMEAILLLKEAETEEQPDS